MEADTGPIGGDLSHEFIILAPTGESQVYFDAAFEEIDYLSADAGGFSHDNPDDLARFFKVMTTHYAATDEKHDAARWDQVAAGTQARGPRH